MAREYPCNLSVRASKIQWGGENLQWLCRTQVRTTGAGLTDHTGHGDTCAILEDMS
jgi:hypothetical protein